MQTYESLKNMALIIHHYTTSSYINFVGLTHTSLMTWHINFCLHDFMIICCAISYINSILSPLNSRCWYARNLRQSVNMSLLITLKTISLLRLFVADVYFFPDGGTQGRGSDEPVKHKQTVCSRLAHTATSYFTRYFTVQKSSQHKDTTTIRK
jgi:hypothetical protein